MKKAVLFLFLTLVWIFVLFPRDFLWQSVESRLKKQGINIETKKVDMSLYLLYNTIKIKDLVVLGNFKASKLDFSYVVNKPFYVNFDGNSTYGVFDGTINIKERKGFVLLKTKRLKDAILKEYLKRTKEGYKYEFDY